MGTQKTYGIMIAASFRRFFFSKPIKSHRGLLYLIPFTTRSVTMSATTTTNPYLEQEGLPRFASITPDDLTPAIERLLPKMVDDFARLEQKLEEESKDESSAVDYEAVLPEVERLQFGLDFAWGVAGHLKSVKDSEGLRKAYEANQPRIVEETSKFSQSKPLYNALLKIEQQWKESCDDGEEKEDATAGDDDAAFETAQKRRAVDLSLRDMKLGGVGLEGAAKERFNEIKQRLAKLSTSFSNNVLDETKAFSVTVDDASKMEGVPESAKAMWAQAHAAFINSQQGEEEGKVEMDAEKGPWRLTLDMPSYIATLKHVRDRSLREKLYMAFVQRASEASGDESKNNVPLIYEILQLKTEMSHLLGFDNYAQLSLAKKMAPNAENVAQLADLIAAKALPAAEKELAEVTALARDKGGDDYGEANLPKLKPWDVTYWTERLKEQKFDLKEEDTRPFFALPAVLDGMFSLVERIFNVRVVAADGDEEVWHPDVRFFRVLDADTDKHIASFFLDPYSRPEDKKGGAWMNTCIGKSNAVRRDIPVAYLVCNGSPPVGEKPSLMSFREVETLFHEFGHGLQHMLTKATVGDVAGINGIEWDAVELPSQFMENWCYDRPTVYGFAKHWETGAPMPEEMFEKLKEQKTFNAGTMATRQLYYGQMDMELHSNFDAAKALKGEGESIFDVQRRMAQKYIPYNLPLDEDRFLCAFQHIFAGGYSAGYYSYKWAEVMSADAFSAFEEVGLDNEEEVRKVGRRFRDTVLSLGGGKEPMAVFESFRGHEPNPEALLRHNGLA